MFRNERDMAEEDVMDTVRLQKLFRKLQRQVHSPEHQVVIQVAERTGPPVSNRSHIQFISADGLSLMSLMEIAKMHNRRS